LTGLTLRKSQEPTASKRNAQRVASASPPHPSCGGCSSAFNFLSEKSRSLCIDHTRRCILGGFPRSLCIERFCSLWIAPWPKQFSTIRLY
jgi:hypothetical protein